MEHPETREIIKGITQFLNIFVGEKDVKFWKKFVAIIIVDLFISLLIIYWVISPTNHEIVSHINPPSFPLYDLYINLPNDIDIDCEIKFGNKLYDCPKKKKIYIKDDVINKIPTIENGENMIISFFVKDKNYKKMENKIIKINYSIYSFDKNYKINKVELGRNFHLDSMIKTSNERKEAKYFYYDIKSHRIDNEGDIYDFSFLNSDETVRYFSWNNPGYAKSGCNFKVYLTKENFYLLTERKRIHGLIIFLLLFSIVKTFIDIIDYILTKKEENQKEQSNKQNKDGLITNESRPDDDNNNIRANIELKGN